MKQAVYVPAVMMLMGACAFGQAPSGASLSGTWVAENNGEVKWLLTETDHDIHIKEMLGERVEADFTCPINGQECAVKIDGHSEKIMVYYNGDKLVELFEGPNGPDKKRLSVSADGKTLTVETVPMSAQQRKETIVFQKQAA